MKNLSINLTNYFIENKIIKKEEAKIYIYSLQLLFLAMGNLAVVFLITLISGKFLLGSVFLMIFMIMRKTVGGYHAKTPLRCMIAFSIIYSSFLWIIAFLPKFYYSSIIILASVFSLIINFSFAPVEDENKPLNEKERKKLRLKSKILTMFFCSLLIFLVFLNEGVIGVSIAISMIASSASVLAKVLVKNSDDPF
ncbi:MAG: accessory gene regulator ArgB-like protein [Eubacteriaceae bacterium]